jgi:methyl-accepting chemotaxis protein
LEGHEPADRRDARTDRSAKASLAQVADRIKSETSSNIDMTISTQEIVGGLALILGMLVAYFIGRSIVKPVVGMTRAMERLAAGDNAVEIPSRDSADEIGAMPALAFSAE